MVVQPRYKKAQLEVVGRHFSGKHGYLIATSLLPHCYLHLPPLSWFVTPSHYQTTSLTGPIGTLTLSACAVNSPDMPNW